MPNDSPRPPAQTRQVAVILSTMRSGSTLLKALLAAAPDVSNLPETNFQAYQSAEAARRIAALAPEPIVALKRPAWFNETRSYPRLPNVENPRCVILARDVHTNVLSLRRMLFRKAEPYIPIWVDPWLASKYWARVYGSLLERFPMENSSNFWIRYEDLVEDPVGRTRELFAFLGSSQKEGVNRYPKPGNYEWKWGTDDGGDKIQSLEVQPPRAVPLQAMAILQRVRELEDVAAVRAKLGYDKALS